MPDKDSRRERILDAAAKQFTLYGYDKANVSDIAKAVGVSKATLYLHFESKEAIFEALLIREMERHSLLWFDLVEQDPQGCTLAGMYKNTLYALNEVPFMGALLRQDRHVLGSYLQKPDSLLKMSQGAKMRQEFVTMMQEAGALRTDINAEHVAAVMNIMSYGLVSLDQGTAIEEVIETIGFILDEALTPADSDPEAGKAIITSLKQASAAFYASLKSEREKRER